MRTASSQEAGGRRHHITDSQAGRQADAINGIVSMSAHIPDAGGSRRG
jgi:hypothetical protein